MSKQIWKPGNMLYPLPVVMVSCGDKKGNTNIITIAWTGTICTDPAMLYISVRPERHSYKMIRETGEFVINLTNKSLAKATDYCGVRSGRDVDKFSDTKLTRGKAENLEYAPIIEESPVSIECRVVEVKELGSHHMFIAEVVSVDVDEKYMDNKGKFRLNSSDLMVYSHGEYYNLKEQLGTFGYSVKRKSSNKMSIKRKPSDKYASSKKSSDKYTSDKETKIKDADFKVTSIKDTGYKTTSNKDSSGKGGNSLNNKNFKWVSSSDKNSSDRSSSDRSSSNRSSSDRSSSNRSSSDRSSSNRSSSDRSSSNRSSSDRSSSDRSSSNRSSNDRSPSNRSSNDRNSSDRNSNNKKYPSKRK